MIIRDNEHKIDEIVSVRGGDGTVGFKRIITAPEQLYNKGSVFSVVTLEPGCSIGWHKHIGDGEYYYVLEGNGEYSDNGTITTLHSGDTAFCPDGEGHSIANKSDKPFKFIALVINN